jgi:hypothetical protein
MGNNKEIRQRMETYRSILLVLNWIVAVVLIIVGFVLTSSRYTQGIGIGVIIGSVVIGVVGHFLINVALAIPFILLNNGDILESMKGNTGTSSDSDDESNDKIKDVRKENVIIINNNDDNTGKIKIIVERTNNAICSAIPFEIFIDKKKAFSIENASCVIDFVDNGSHSIYALLDYNTQSEIVNFNTDNPEIKFKLSVLGVGKIKLEKIV